MIAAMPRLAPCALLLVAMAAGPAAAAGQSVDHLGDARRLYNRQLFEMAIRAASEARDAGERPNEAALIIARSHLERFRQTRDAQNLTAARCAEVGAELVDKDALFRRSDVLSVHVVLSGRTRGLVGSREIGLMKPTAYLINTSRGPIVDEAALIDALASRAIAGAGLDVFDQEPLPADHPFRTLPNTVLTPHIGGRTRENFTARYKDCLEDVQAWLAGKPVRVLEP